MQIQNRVVIALLPLSIFPLLFFSSLHQSLLDLLLRLLCLRLRRLRRRRSPRSYCYRYRYLLRLSLSSFASHSPPLLLVIVDVARRALFFLSFAPSLSKTNPPLPRCSSETSDLPLVRLARCSFSFFRPTYRSELNYRSAFLLSVPSVQSSPKLP